MNIIKCPECGSEDLFVYDIDGCIKEGRIIEETECLKCNHIFTVKAELSKIEIEIEKEIKKCQKNIKLL